MTIQDWLGLTLTSLTILTIIGVAVRWVVRHYLKDVLHELKPNGGSSLKDQVNRLEKEIKDANDKRQEMSNKIDHLYDLFIDYLASNKKPSRAAKSKNEI